MSDPPENHRFDELARALATASSSRRGFITRLAAGIAGGAVAIVGGGGAVLAASRCSPVGHSCLRNNDCCSGFCDATHHPAHCATRPTPAPRRSSPPPPPIGG
jgi:hypothetical protein